MLPALSQAANTAADQIMTQVKGAKAVVIASEDGFEIAARVENTAQISRLSAIASSLSALGEVAGSESMLGSCEYISIQAQEGHILTVNIARDGLNIIASVVTSKDAITGQVLYFTRQALEPLRHL